MYVLLYVLLLPPVQVQTKKNAFIGKWAAVYFTSDSEIHLGIMFNADGSCTGNVVGSAGSTWSVGEDGNVSIGDRNLRYEFKGKKS